MSEIAREPTVLLIGDSFGIQRVHDGEIDVPLERTWPSQVARSLSAVRTLVDFTPYRRFTEIPPLVARTPADVTIVQAGVVDCYPRPLPLELSRAPSPIARFVRRALIRPLRRPWMRFVYRTTWSSKGQMDEAMAAFARLVGERRIGFITVTPALRKHAAITPGGDEAIAAFNDRLRELARSDPKAFLIDAFAEIISSGRGGELLSSFDGHLSQVGNDWLAERVVETLRRELGHAAMSPAEQ